MTPVACDVVAIAADLVGIIGLRLGQPVRGGIRCREAPAGAAPLEEQSHLIAVKPAHGVTERYDADAPLVVAALLVALVLIALAAEHRDEIIAKLAQDDL